MIESVDGQDSGPLPWAELITGNPTPAERKKAIANLFETINQPMSLSEEVVFISCSQLAIMRLLSDLLEQRDESQEDARGTLREEKWPMAH